MDFALGVLARVTEGQKAAAAAEKRRAAAAAAARRKALEERKQREKERIRQDVDKMLSRTNRPKRRTIAKRRDGVTRAKSRKMTPDEVAMKIRGVAPPKPPGPSSTAREKAKKPSGPPKALPGMEFVERRERKKEIKVPHTSDYSDLFGDDYLVGIDLKCVSKMKEESAKATKEAQKIISEKKALKEKRMREAEEATKISEEMKRRGLKEKHRNEWRLKTTEKDWVAVAVPTSSLTPHEKAKLKATGSSSQGSAVGSPNDGSGARKVSKAKRVDLDAAEIARKKAALRENILNATRTAPASKPRRARSPSSSPERRPVASSKRKRVMEPERRLLGSERRSYGDQDRRSARRSYEARGSKRPRYEDRHHGYNSEEWDDEFDDDDDDDDSDEDLFGIEALEREEERSARLGALEDKRERQNELRRKKEKERKRLEFERSQMR